MADAGGEMYNCAISVPSLDPVFASVNVTVITFSCRYGDVEVPAPLGVVPVPMDPVTDREL